MNFRHILVFIVVVVLAVLAGKVRAADNAPYSSSVLTSECEVVAKSDSVLGTAAGGVAGAVAGGVAGRMLGGKRSKLGGWGALIGAGVGAYAGNKIASNKTYSCLISFKDKSQQIIYTTTISTRQFSSGQVVNVYPSANGSVIVK